MTESRPSHPNPIHPVVVRRALLEWFRRSARPLPWRQSKDPYAVWVSEIMLQQTQVDTVIPYFLRFLRAFPGFERLAEAPLERVLELWSGLGYYRRARHLHLAAQRIVQDFGGAFPSNYQEARSLPGVGDYTARAVLSIAYNQPYAVVDGNVARVVSRLRTLSGNLHQRKFRHALTQELEFMFSRRQPGNFNQAIMELGQSLCLPRAPKCPLCPLRTICQAHRDGTPEAYPEPRPRRASEMHYLATVVLCRAHRGPFGPRSLVRQENNADLPIFPRPRADYSKVPITAKSSSGDRHKVFKRRSAPRRPAPQPALRGTRRDGASGQVPVCAGQGAQPELAKPLQVALGRGLDEGLMDGLWNFPAAFGSSPGEAVSRLQAKLRDITDSRIRWGSRPDALRPVAQLHHGITYRSISVDIYVAEVNGSIATNRLRWFTLSRLPRSAVSSLARKITEKVVVQAVPTGRKGDLG